jgi:hypothetical protein
MRFHGFVLWRFEGDKIAASGDGYAADPRSVEEPDQDRWARPHNACCGAPPPRSALIRISDAVTDLRRTPQVSGARISA